MEQYKGLPQLCAHRTNLLKLGASALLAICAVLGAGCTLTPTVAEPVAEVKQAPVPKPKPRPAVKPAPIVAPEPAPPHVSILLSDGKPAYQNVATELSALLQDSSVYNLADEGLTPDVAMGIMAETHTDVVVAIGLRAAIAATASSKFPVVFCQVFNFSDHDLIGDQFKGVASLPPLHIQIEAWKRLDPNLKNIGAILGDGHERLIDEAITATEQHGLKLYHRTAQSDRETLYLFNQLLPDIDGFLLFPDNRVLSPSVLRQMLDYASRHDIQVAVFSESLLDMGATLSATAIASDIAMQIVAVVDQFADGSGEGVADMTPLTTARVQTNHAVLKSLGLVASPLTARITEGEN